MQAEKHKDAHIFSAKLIGLRNSRDWNQHELARMLGIHWRTVQGWEAGDHVPHGANLHKITQLFGVSPDFLFGLEGDDCLREDAVSPVSGPAWAAQLLTRLYRMSDVQRARVIPLLLQTIDTVTAVEFSEAKVSDEAAEILEAVTEKVLREGQPPKAQALKRSDSDPHN